MRLKTFSIDECYLTDVYVTQERDLIKDRQNLTNEDLIKIMKGQDKFLVSTSTKDHDEFTKLRNLLEEQGYIKTERNWWNGDQVLKPFKLNEWIFRRDQRFPCAASIKNSIMCARKYGWKKICF